MGSSRCETLPSRGPASNERPRLPTTTRRRSHRPARPADRRPARRATERVHDHPYTWTDLGRLGAILLEISSSPSRTSSPDIQGAEHALHDMHDVQLGASGAATTAASRPPDRSARNRRLRRESSCRTSSPPVERVCAAGSVLAPRLFLNEANTPSAEAAAARMRSVRCQIGVRVPPFRTGRFVHPGVANSQMMLTVRTVPTTPRRQSPARQANFGMLLAGDGGGRNRRHARPHHGRPGLQDVGGPLHPPSVRAAGLTTSARRCSRSHPRSAHWCARTRC